VIEHYVEKSIAKAAKNDVSHRTMHRQQTNLLIQAPQIRALSDQCGLDSKALKDFARQASI
jgi:hypothetical protein